MKVGDAVLVKGTGPLFRVLSFSLGIFDSHWRHREWKPWHTGFISRQDQVKGWMICESLGQGVAENPLSNYSDYRAYCWLEEIDQEKVNQFVAQHLGESYDILVYPWTAVAYILRHVWGRPIPRLFDKSWSCWELVYYFYDRMGKPLSESYDFPMVNELLNKLEAK